MPPPDPPFVPAPDVILIINSLLDRVERRAAGNFSPVPGRPLPRSIKIILAELALPGYFSQMNPEPRQVTNGQFQWLANAGILRLSWQPGEKGHLLESAALVPGAEAPLYTLLDRIPTHNLRARLESLLFGDRFRFVEDEWRFRAIQHILTQLKENKSPSPFVLADPAFNEDLLTALTALAQLNEETPYRVFSVRTFNDSKRFEDLKKAVIRLARSGQPAWKHLPEDELLRELNLVPNPTFLLLAGAWTLVTTAGEVISLAEFSPSVGLAAVQVMHLQRVTVRATQVLCVENLTTFHALAASLAGNPQQIALLCLAGNPSPPCRRLLIHLSASLPEDIPLQVWADLDYGGFNILAQLRKEVSPRCVPYAMDIETFDRFEQFARPLTQSDRHHLERLTHDTRLRDVHPVISYLLKRGLKLEQEAIFPHSPSLSG